jgi:hypothetical protein
LFDLLLVQLLRMQGIKVPEYCSRLPRQRNRGGKQECDVKHEALKWFMATSVF